MPLANLGQVNANSLSVRICSILKEAILSGNLAPSTHMVEAELASRFGTSVTPVREALRMLSTSGLVVTKPYVGTYVVDITKGEADEIYEVREFLEPVAILQASTNMSAEVLAVLTTCLKNAERSMHANDLVALSESNRAFHSTIIQHCNNLRIKDILLALQDQVKLISVKTWSKSHSQESEWQWHMGILQALRNADGQGASDLMRQHIREFRAFVQSRMD